MPGFLYEGPSLSESSDGPFLLSAGIFCHEGGILFSFVACSASSSLLLDLNNAWRYYFEP